MVLAATLALGLLVTAGAASATPRTRTKFDFDWRFQLGPQPVPAPAVDSVRLRNCSAGTPCDPKYDDSGWRELDVPHDFMIEGTFTPKVDPNHGALPRNVSWYRKTFELPALSSPDDLVYLTFDGAYRAADVYVNGALAKHHDEGYTSFVVWLHNASEAGPLKFGPGGKNVVSVFLDATTSELWCYEGGGIYRHVWLETASAVSVTPWGFAAPTAIAGDITGADCSKPQTTPNAVLAPRFDIANARGVNVSGTAQIQLRDGDGKLVLENSTKFSVPAGGFLRVASDAKEGTSMGLLSFGSASAPVKLWNTAMAPPLYTATLTLTDAAGHVLDTMTVRIGVRSAVFDARVGFVLNGVPTRLKGTSNHLGFGGVGNAEPDRVMEYRIAKLKQMGSNAFRTAHNPVAPELIEYADRYGMLVWEENRFVTSGVQPLASTRGGGHGGPRAPNVTWAMPTDTAGWVPPTDKDADPRLLLDAQDMVIRDRNSPSVVVWSLCNELGCVAGDPNGGDLAVQFKLAVYAVDTTRPVTGNTVQTPYLGNRFVDGFASALDVQSFSYDYDSYATFHSMSPWKPVGGGESASCQMDRGYYGPTDRKNGYMGMFDNGFPPVVPTDASMDVAAQPLPDTDGRMGVFECARRSWSSVMALPYVYGNFAWTGMDYKGETTLGWPDVNSHYGIHDMAGFAKDSVGYYEAWWREDATCVGISISPAEWTAPVAVGTPITVHVTTCAPFAALYVNGVLQSLGPSPRKMDRFGFLSWLVPFKPGNISAFGYDAAGKEISSKTIVSAKVPKQLKLTVDAPYNGRNASQLAADGQDVVLLRAELLDSDGTVVPNADLNVSFEVVTGPAAVIGVANGDPADHSPDKGAWRRTFHGLARAIVASSKVGATGTVVVKAVSAGMQSGQVVLEAV